MKLRATQKVCFQLLNLWVISLVPLLNTSRRSRDVYLEAGDWHTAHPGFPSYPEAHAHVTTEVAYFAQEEWERGGTGYLTGGLGYAGVLLGALTELRGLPRAIPYFGTSAEIREAYRYGEISYEAAKELAKWDAARAAVVELPRHLPWR